MRLQCPNCDAEYEVDASAIPFEGRDVQCSNCGHGWFQSHPDFETDYEVEASLYDPPPPMAKGGDTAGGLPKRQLEPDALRILREEVALEEAKRAEDAARAAPAAAARADDGLEAELDAMVAGDAAQASFDAQPDGLSYTSDADTRDIEAQLDAGQNPPDQSADFVAPSPRVSPRRVARLKGLNDEAIAQNASLPAQPEPAQQAFADDAATSERRDMRADLAPITSPKKSGGRAGFYTVVAAAILAAAGYILGPELSAAVPALAGHVESYLNFVNGLRDQVQVIVPQGIGMAQGMAQGAVQFVQDWLVAQGWL